MLGAQAQKQIDTLLEITKKQGQMIDVLEKSIILQASRIDSLVRTVRSGHSPAN